MAKGKPAANRINDDVMVKQSAFFGSTSLSRAYDLAGPRAATGPVVRANENLACLGGMRRPDRSAQAHDGYKKAGRHLLCMLEEFVDEFPATLDVAESLRTGERVTGFVDSIATEFRERWLRVLGA